MTLAYPQNVKVKQETFQQVESIARDEGARLIFSATVNSWLAIHVHTL